ncbi:hypothetical protein BgiMline_004349, partial [Biomphalaria glabrata]
MCLKHGPVDFSCCVSTDSEAGYRKTTPLLLLCPMSRAHFLVVSRQKQFVFLLT